MTAAEIRRSVRGVTETKGEGQQRGTTRSLVLTRTTNMTDRRTPPVRRVGVCFSLTWLNMIGC